MTEEEYNEIMNYSNFMIDSANPYDMEIKNALEKQIPAKPEEVYEEQIRLNGIWSWTCGKCGSLHTNDYPLNYCSNCGQAVKWEL